MLAIEKGKTKLVKQEFNDRKKKLLEDYIQKFDVTERKEFVNDRNLKKAI